MFEPSRIFDDPALIAEREEGVDAIELDVQQEEANMATSKQSQSQKPTDTTHAFFDALGGANQYSQQSVMEKTIRACVNEIARQQHLSDRIQCGDEAIHDANGQRPAPDETGQEQGPRLTERQYEIVVQCKVDEDALLDAVIALRDLYVARFAEGPTYALVEDPASESGWTQITDFRKALENEYTKVHRNWLQKQQSARDPHFTVDGAEAIIAQQRERSQSKMSQL